MKNKKPKIYKKIQKIKKENSKIKWIRLLIAENLLNIWLILLLIGNIFTAFLYIILNSYLVTKFPHVPPNIFYLFGFFAIGNILSVIALLKEKKWGFYLFSIIALIIFTINIMRKLDMVRAIIGLTPLIILYVLLVNKWKNIV